MILSAPQERFRPLLVAAILTSFNRRESTLRCLSCLQNAAAIADVTLRAFLTDDGSTDGTADAVAMEFPWVKVIRGNGTLFWNRGMRLGMAEALQDPHIDALLWLNDDTMLHPEGMIRLVETLTSEVDQKGRPAIVVGATNDGISDQPTYSGQVAVSKWQPFKFRKIYSPSEAVACETMNGNVVLVPKAIGIDVGNLDPVFEHAMGDIDYGLRARRRGHSIVVAPGFVGLCRNNPTSGSFLDPSLPLLKKWKLMMGRKGLPWRSWLQLTRRHGGLLWPLYFGWPYVRLIALRR